MIYTPDIFLFCKSHTGFCHVAHCYTGLKWGNILLVGKNVPRLDETKKPCITKGGRKRLQKDRVKEQPNPYIKICEG